MSQSHALQALLVLQQRTATPHAMLHSWLLHGMLLLLLLHLELSGQVLHVLNDVLQMQMQPGAQLLCAAWPPSGWPASTLTGGLRRPASA